MTPRLSDEQRQALSDQAGAPLEVEDELTRKVYVIVPKDDFRRMVDDELRWQLQIGFDQADRGELEEWSVDDFLKRMHEQHPATSP